MNNQYNNELTTAAYWDQVWEHLDRVSVISEQDPRFGRNGDFLRLLKRNLDQRSKLSVLELGGAWSYKALALAKWWDAEVTIIDQSPVGIKTTEAIFDANQCEADIILGDFFQHDFHGKKFDLVLHFGLLEHFTDPQPVLKTCETLLTETGTLLFTMPNMAAWAAFLWRKWSPNDWSKHIYHSDAAVETASQAVGLKVRNIFHWGPPMLQIALWERSGLLPKALTLLQGALNLPGKILPLYDRGCPQLSMHRGFVACKAG